MKISKKYIDLIVAELKSPLTYEVNIERNVDEEKAMVITIKQTYPVEYFGTPEMRGLDELSENSDALVE